MKTPHMFEKAPTSQKSLSGPSGPRAPETPRGTLPRTPPFSGTPCRTLSGRLRARRARKTLLAGRGFPKHMWQMTPSARVRACTCVCADVCMCAMRVSAFMPSMAFPFKKTKMMRASCKLGSRFKKGWPGPSAEMCRGFLLCKFWRILPGIFLEDFSGHFFPQK